MGCNSNSSARASCRWASRDTTRRIWVLVDYGDFIVHVFSTAAREFYGLERLWRQAKEVKLPEAAEA